MAEENKFLEIVDLKKGYGSGETRQEVLRGMTFSVVRGEICVLLGPSGSGKSTLLNIIGGIDSADAGFISIGGDKLEDMGEKALTQYRRKHLGYVFQLYNLIANLNVKENIEVGAYLSDAPLDIDEDNVATVITERDITKMADQLDHSMGSYMTYFQYLCVLLSAVLIYLLTKLIMEKNENAISIVKILGYENREIARLYLLCELCLPLVKVGGAFLSMKSVESDEELESAKKAIKTLGGQVERTADYQIPGTEVVHRVIFIKKITETPKKYPRPFAKIKKNPL